MAILQLNSFRKLIKDIFIMVFILLAIQLITRIFKVELIFYNQNIKNIFSDLWISRLSHFKI